MSDFADFAGFLYDVLDAASEIQRRRGSERAEDALERFIEELIAADPDREIQRTGPDSIRRGDTDLVYLETRIDPDRERLLEEIRRDLEAWGGGAIQVIDTPGERTIRFQGEAATSSIRAWLVPHRGWVFLVSAPEKTDTAGLAATLDARLAALENSPS